MAGSDLLLAGVLFLFAAVIAVPLASRLGIGAVLGYLLAGIAIGPWGLGFISDVDEILHFSELGVVFLIPILTEYWATGLVPRFPTLIVCGFVLIAALQSLFAGLVLQSMEQKNKQDFEMQLIAAHEAYKNLQKDEKEQEQ